MTKPNWREELSNKLYVYSMAVRAREALTYIDSDVNEFKKAHDEAQEKESDILAFISSQLEKLIEEIPTEISAVVIYGEKPDRIMVKKLDELKAELKEKWL